jgi:late competence protein required for DNA uptake (superfamily II DNA/RNA helicase)
MKFVVELSFEGDTPEEQIVREYIMNAIIHHQSRYKSKPVAGLDSVTVLTEVEDMHQTIRKKMGENMNEIKTCPHCGSMNIKYVNWGTQPACYCDSCNLLMTKLSDDQLLEIVDDEKCEQVDEKCI